MGIYVAFDYSVYLWQDVSALLQLYSLPRSYGSRYTLSRCQIQWKYKRVKSQVTQWLLSLYVLIDFREFFSREIEDYVFRDYESKGAKRLRSSRNSKDIPWIVEKLGSGEYLALFFVFTTDYFLVRTAYIRVSLI